MKNGSFFLLLLIFPFTFINAQTSEETEESFSIISGVHSYLEDATGYSMQDNGMWASKRNKIPHTNSKTNKNPTPREKLGVNNFTALELRTVTIKKNQYNVLVVRYQDGTYEFPKLQEEWKPFESVEFFVFKAENLKKILPKEIPFNKPYAVNTEVYCSGKVRNFDFKLLESLIVSKIQATLNKTHVNGTNLIFAVLPVQKDGKETVKFKLIKTYPKRSFNSFWLDKKNADKLFDKSYYEAKLFKFKEFIRKAEAFNIPFLNDDEADFASYYKYGVLKYQTGNYNGAIEDFNKALNLNPEIDFSLIYSYRGIANHKAHNYNAAIEDFDKALDIKPKDYNEGLNWIKNYHNRGVSRFYMNDIEGACADWKTAFENGFGGSLEYLEQFCK
jgi:tetratricopeptide (TPR) repeat protein